MMKAIVLAGLPGTGKSVVGMNIALIKGYGYISTGDIARELEDKSWQDKGELAPENYIRKRFMEEVNKCIKEGLEGVVIDGMPRTVEQVYFISSLFPSIDYIFLHASYETLISRLLGRHRKDDKIDIIKNRLRVAENSLEDIHYHVLSFLPYNIRRDRIFTIDTDNKSISVIRKQTMEVLQ